MAYVVLLVLSQLAECSNKQELSCTEGNVALGRSCEDCCRGWDRESQP